MKKICIYLAHPAHFHLFKNVIKRLQNDNEVIIVYNDKDVLQELISSSNFSCETYKVKTNRNISSKSSLLFQFVFKIYGAFKLFKKLKPSIVIGTPVLISIIGRLLPYKSVIVNEDDFDIVYKTANLGYPHANNIICPEVCRTLTYGSKCVKYNSYHELAYLHPNHFSPSIDIVSNYFDASKTYFIIRFAKLMAHHDEGISGINNDIALKIIEILKPFGEVYITSEREISKELEPYRIAIKAKDMHHVMAYASLFVGDSQTMAAEAGVLGIPFVRFNDFVGRISYLEELENKYNLGFGIKTNEVEKLFNTITELVNTENLKDVFQARRVKMLSEKIDYAAFLTWFIDNYPNSVNIMKENPDYQYNFK